MPTQTEVVIEGFASCKDGRCPGYKQESARVVLRQVEYTYFDLGGDIPGVERSTVDVAGFEDPDDSPCPVCGKPRIASEQMRPEYPPMSGQDPDFILHQGQTDSQVRDMQMENLRRDKELAELREQLAQQNLALAHGATPAPRRAKARPEGDEE